MGCTLVIGFGNPLRRDDGLGWAAASEVRDRAAGTLVEVLTVHELVPDLAEPLSRATLAIMIDAAVDAAPGRAVWRTVEVGPAAPVTPAFTHQVTPEVLGLLARELYGRCPRILLCTVGGADFGTGDRLSAPVAAALPGIVGDVLEAARHA